MSELLLFPTDEFIDPRIVRIMSGNTCRTCKHRGKTLLGNEKKHTASVCTKIPSRRSWSGLLRMSVDQPACIQYERKDK